MFWVFLWQLKEYHIGRFIDHFRTEKGKRIVFAKPLILKLILLFLFLVSTGYGILYKSFSLSILTWLVLILYFLESCKFLYDLFKRKLKKPVFTKKTIFLIFSIFTFQLLYFLLYFFTNTHLLVLNLLIFDVLTPFIVSGIILITQPLAVLMRNTIIKKAKIRRAQFKNLIAIGITGSYGKTATKEFLFEILSEKLKVFKTKEHQNSEIGISQCILEGLRKDYEVFIAEMGAYNRGGIKLLCDIVKPKIGILTGINEQHLATFGSLENIKKGKYELIESLPKDGMAIFNGNNKYCEDLYFKTNISKRISYSQFPEGIKENISYDVWAEDVKIEKECITFKIFSKDGDSAYFKVNLLGAQNIENILLAVCCAKELGMSLKEISKACEKIKQTQGGMKLFKTRGDINIIDATYSANPNGVISHLEYLKIWEGKKIIVMPCLIELGKASKEVHKRIGEKIAKVCDLAIIVAKECFSIIQKSSTLKGMKKENILFLEDPREIVGKIKEFCKPGDIVLLEGRIPKEITAFLFDSNYYKR